MEHDKTIYDIEVGRIFRRRHVPRWRLLARRTKKSTRPVASPSQELIVLTTKLEDGTVIAKCSLGINAEEYVRFVQAEYNRHCSRFEQLLSPKDIKNKSSWLLKVVAQLHDYLRSPESSSVAGAVTCLLDKRTIHVPSENVTDHQQICMEFVFTLMGIMTMLYAPLAVKSTERTLFIKDTSPNGQYRFEQYAVDRTDSREAFRPLAAMLNGFGELWPHCQGQDQIEASPVRSAQFNGAVFASIGRIRFEWTDLLPAHLDFDTASRTLYIFQRPTFCLLNIPSEPPVADKTKKTVLNSCFEGTNRYGYPPGSNDEAEYMKEVLLSIHLIFGQSAKSRNLFRRARVSGNCSKVSPDTLLHMLCSQPWPFTDWSQQPKKSYQFHADFPILGMKLQGIQDYLQGKQPSNIWLLWRDQRNPMQWWTFWAVLIIGGLGLLFAIVQTGLSAAQSDTGYGKA